MSLCLNIKDSLSIELNDNKNMVLGMLEDNDIDYKEINPGKNFDYSIIISNASEVKFKGTKVEFIRFGYKHEIEILTYEECQDISAFHYIAKVKNKLLEITKSKTLKVDVDRLNIKDLDATLICTIDNIKCRLQLVKNNLGGIYIQTARLLE